MASHFIMQICQKLINMFRSGTEALFDLVFDIVEFNKI